MPICSALTRHGHPCRGHGTPVDGCATAYLCHMHRDYFTDHNADNHVTEIVNPYMTDTEREWIFRMLKSPLYKADPKWLVEHFKELTLSRQESMERRTNYLYDLYVMAGVLAPFASLQFWRRCIEYNLHVIWYCATYNAESGRMEFSSEFPKLVSTFFRHFVKGLPPHVVLPYLLAFMGKMFRIKDGHQLSPEVRKECSAQIWTAILEVVVPMMSARAMMCYPVETVLERVDVNHTETPQSIWRHPGMRDTLRALLKNMQLAERKAAQDRFAPLCEEIMMAAWHPTRVMRWLEAGIEMEDM
jgi:hypothetical protein